MPPDQRASSPAALEALAALEYGELTILGRLPWSSNFTFLVSVDYNGITSQAIYKPVEGEQPLGDFPEGLYRREVAAYVLSVGLGWPNIPETVARHDAPFGLGSLQRFVPAHFEHHYFTLKDEPEFAEQFCDIAAFDLIANNADRKAGHCLLGHNGNIWAIDNGLCFHPQPKLRTVLWDFGGHAISLRLITDIAQCVNSLPDSLSQLLTSDELIGVEHRMRSILENPVFPEVQSQRQYPWPLV